MEEKPEARSSNANKEANEKSCFKQTRTPNNTNIKNLLIILAIGACCAGLYYLSRQNYLLFHSVVEIFSIIIALAIFVIAWNTRRIVNNSYLLFIGISFLFVAAFIILHTLAYRNMGVFPEVGTNLATQLWIATRYLLSFSLLAAPMFITRKIRPLIGLIIYSFISLLLILSIFVWNIFPISFIDATGGIAGHLTLFKVASEYIIALILVCSIILLIRKRKELSYNVTKLMAIAMGVAIATGMSFTLYTDAFGLSNAIGHLLNVISFYLIYKALIETALNEPLELLFRDLKQNEMSLTKQKAELTDIYNQLKHEISERKKTEDELIKSEAKYASLFANMLNGFAHCKMIYDETGKPTDFIYLEINSAFEKLTGLTKSVVVGRKVTEAIPGIEKANPELFEIYGRVATTGKEDKIEIFFKPLQIWLSISLYSPEKGYFAAIFENITERKNFEATLADSEAKYRALVENADDAIVLTDMNGKTIFKNQAYYKNLGFEEGKDTPAEENIKIHPDDLEKVKAGNVQLLKTGFSTSEYRVKHRNGKWVYRFARSTLIRKADNQFYTVLSIIRDITELKEIEAKLKEESERIELANEKLRVVGSLTRHDVRNKLSLINGYAYLIKKKHKDQIGIVDGVDKIENAVASTERIFEFAKMYEQLGVEKLSLVEVNETVNIAFGFFPDLNVKVINDCQGIHVLADSFLRQLFYNLIDNTRKYGKKTTTIRIHFEKDRQDSLKLIYEDDGVGISKENKPKLFSEGFSTGGSTGFGLFLIKRMMEIYGWTIAEEGTPGRGAKFTITIPKQNKEGKQNYQVE